MPLQDPCVIAWLTHLIASRVNKDFELMYVNLRHRSRETILTINDILIGMALDSRLMPGVASEMRSVRSSASTPSLRSRDGSFIGRMDAPGGNVRVVVRVRGFLPRGKIDALFDFDKDY